MPYYLIENFAKGLDLRKSVEVAPPGSLRVLRNAHINSGGEIEKRKAWVRNETLTDYGQDSRFKGKIVGPMQAPALTNMAFYRHHADDLPTTGFTAGAGLSGSTYASYTEDGMGLQSFRYWVHKNYNAGFRIGSPLMPFNSSVREFGAGDYPGFNSTDFSGQVYAVDQTYDGSLEPEYWHYQHYILVDTGEPFEFDPDSGQLDRVQQITLKNKSYTIADDILYSSAVGDPLDFVSAGSGSLKFSSQGVSIGQALSLSVYYGQLTIFGPRGAQFYDVDPDFALTQYLRTVETNLFAPRSVVGYADGDLMYLARSGVRSLQARDSSNLAITNDVGSPIDTLIRDEIRYNPDITESVGGTLLPVSDFYQIAKSVVYPMTGEYWLFLKEKAYVLARHPAANVLAWSTYDLPRPDSDHLNSDVGDIKSRWCADACRIGDTITFRNFADEMFVYGGSGGEQYDDSEAEVVTPFMDMERPGDNKYFMGLDLVCEGLWEVQAATEPVGDGVPIRWFKVAEIDGRTRGQYRVPMQAQGTQLALRFTCKSPRQARLSQIAIYYETGSQK